MTVCSTFSHGLRSKCADLILPGTATLRPERERVYKSNMQIWLDNIYSYSEPFLIHSQNRALHALSRCSAANFAHE